MTCLEVRDRLVERSLGALHLEDATEVDRHLLWCAACRKEAAELDRAAATFALTLAPASPDAGLEDRVVSAVHAAAVAVSALGWGVAMAGRAERFRDNATKEQVRQSVLIRRIDALVGDQVFQATGNKASLGTLAPTSGGIGGGSVGVGGCDGGGDSRGRAKVTLPSRPSSVNTR